MKLPVKVVPGSSRACIAGWLSDCLKVRVKSPAERGKANAAVEKMVAAALGVPTDSVHIIKGKTCSRKIIEITGLGETEVYNRLSKVVSSI